MTLFYRESLVRGSTREKAEEPPRAKEADLPRERQWLPRLTERGSVAVEHPERLAWPWRHVRQDRPHMWLSVRPQGRESRELALGLVKGSSKSHRLADFDLYPQV